MTKRGYSQTLSLYSFAKNDVHACFIILGFHGPWNEGNKVIARSIINTLSRKIKVSVVSPMHLSSTHYSDTYRDVNIKSIYISKNIPAPDYLYEIQILRAIKEVDKEGANVYHLFDGINYSYAAAITNIFQKPVIVHSTIYEHHYMTGLDRVRGKIGHKLYSKYVTLFLSTSPLVARKLLQYGINQFKVKILPPSINTSLFRPLSVKIARKIIGIDQDAFLITYLGTIRPARFPYKVVIGAIKRLVKDGHNNAMLCIVSPLDFYDNTGIENRKFAKQILMETDTLGLSHNLILRLRDLNEEEKVLLYNSSDVVLMPFIRPTAVDPPISLLEAMACGSVVVASNIQSIPHVIKDKENGFLMSNVTIDHLYEVLRHIIKDRDKLVELREKGRIKIINNFNLENAVHKLLSFYDLIKVI